MNNAKIIYKENVIAILEDGKEIVVKCKDWRMRGDIIVKWIEEEGDLPGGSN